MESLKIIFAGTPEFAVPTLQSLIDSKHQVVAVYTQPDRKSGRGQQISMSPIKTLALQHEIPIEQPDTLKDIQQQEILKNYNADVMIVIAYGMLLPQTILDIPKFGCINIHASLLPRWRGAAPIQQAILAGDEKTGITIMQMDKGLDTGDMLLKIDTEILLSDTSQILHDRLAKMGAESLLKVLEDLSRQKLNPEKQNESLATYAKKINKSDAQIDWHKSAKEILRQIRAYNPWPVAFTHLNNEIIRIWQAEIIDENSKETPGKIFVINSENIEVCCGLGKIRLLVMQFPGGKTLSAKTILSGNIQKFIGQKFN